MTADIWVRYVLMPALGSAAFVALVISLRQEWRWWRQQRKAPIPSSAQLVRQWEEEA